MLPKIPKFTLIDFQNQVSAFIKQERTPSPLKIPHCPLCDAKQVLIIV
ncbi:hypothetical protein [Helicobacter heilmannii]|nr:hypothetical protein [Helicobacter heilmannii]CRF45641.1 hypothetical protein HHE014_06090 [Helicobacter heilmannii]CRF48262.1 hypothetical protein HHE02_15840 [Helicobacter heilmannii]